MNDVEHDLRELLDRKAGSVGSGGPEASRWGARTQPSPPVRARRWERSRPWRSASCPSLDSERSTAAQPDGAVPVDDPWAGYDGLRTHRDDRDVHDHEPERLVPRRTSGRWAPEWRPPPRQAARARSPSSLAVTMQHSRNVCERTSTSGPEPVAEPGPLPMLLLSRTDPGLGASPCLQGGVRLPSDAAMLEVAIDMRVVAQTDAGDGPACPRGPSHSMSKP